MTGRKIDRIMIAVFVAWLVTGVGYLINVVQVVTFLSNDPTVASASTPLMLAKFVGVLFAPLGAVLGLFSF
jgi:hypothetical protein